MLRPEGALFGNFHNNLTGLPLTDGRKRVNLLGSMCPWEVEMPASADALMET
jgi:hypothetical protein